MSATNDSQKFEASVDTMYRPNGKAFAIRFDTAFFAPGGHIERYISNRSKLWASKDTLKFYVPSYQILFGSRSNVKVSFFSSSDLSVPQAIYHFRKGLVQYVYDPHKLSDSAIALSLATEHMRMDFYGRTNIKWNQIGQSGIRFHIVKDEYPAYSIYKFIDKIIRVPFSTHPTFLKLFQSDPKAFDLIFQGCRSVPVSFSEISYSKYFEGIGIKDVLYLDRPTEGLENDLVILQLLNRVIERPCDPIIRLRKLTRDRRSILKLVSVEHGCTIP